MADTKHLLTKKNLKKIIDTKYLSIKKIIFFQKKKLKKKLWFYLVIGFFMFIFAPQKERPSSYNFCYYSDSVLEYTEP